MPNRVRPMWIAVMDGTQARFFALHPGNEGQVFEEAMNPLIARVDRRGASHDKPGRGQSAAGGGHHAIGRRNRDTTRFTRQVAGTLGAALAQHIYEQLVVVAPPRTLAELNGVLPLRVRETLVHQIPKNLTKLNADTLWDKLSLVLLKAARPVNGVGARVPTVSGNSLPVSVVFRNMEASTSVQSAAVKFAAKLGRKFGSIQTCRVTVDAPKHIHRKVKEFRVAVDLRLPGHEIATRTASGDSGSHDDLNTAMRAAFGSAARQLQDHLDHIKKGILRERRQSSPRTRGLVEA